MKKIPFRSRPGTAVCSEEFVRNWNPFIAQIDSTREEVLMRLQQLLVVLTLVNLGVLIFALAQTRAVAAQGTAQVLRGRGLEIVDEQGKVRASIKVLPATTQKNGEPSAETVLLRLITEKGRPSVKLGASEEGAILALTGPSGTKNTYAQLGAKGANSWLTLKNEDGREQTLKP